MFRCLLALMLLSSTAWAGPQQATAQEVTRAALQVSDTLRLEVLKSLARGDIAGAIVMWELETGQAAPQWLLAMQSAFSVANQRAGPCIQVARSVFEGFKRLGAKPSYVRFITTGNEWQYNLISFDLRAGEPRSAIQISDKSLHFTVQVGERFYDAMTGPAGLTIAEYMKRLDLPGSISIQIVSQLP